MGYQPIQLNSLNKLNSPRIVCSKVNENEYLTNMERHKSFTTSIKIATDNEYVSPIIYTDTAFTEFRSNRLNNPITDYANSNLVNTPNSDPNSAIYVSDIINLSKPADSLKVIFSAYRNGSSDIRVLYNLIRPDDASQTESNIRFELFPGYDNLKDTTGDGFGNQVLDSAKNDGLSDSFVPASVDDEFLEYQYTADDLGEFIGYSIKIIMAGTNQAYAPRIKDFRTIALK